MAKRDLAYAYNLAGDLDRAATYATEAVDTATSTPADWFRPATRERVLQPAASSSATSGFGRGA